MKRNRERGFTLIELLVVVAILGVLAGVAVPRVMTSLKEARDRANEANVAMLQSAIERWALDNNPGGTLLGWGGASGILATSVSDQTGITATVGTHAIRQAALTPYISKYPSNPAGTGYRVEIELSGSIYIATIESY